MSDQPPVLDSEDHIIDRDWFYQHPDRTCYARQHRDGWALLVRRVAQPRPGRQRKTRILIPPRPERPPPPEYDPPVMLRVWDQSPTVPPVELRQAIRRLDLAQWH
jgi:hypothetical protein